MNLKHRKRVASLTVNFLVWRANVLGFAMRFVGKLFDLRTAFLNRRTRKLEELGKFADTWRQRWESIAPQSKTLEDEAAPRKQLVLAARAALIKEQKQIQVAASRLKIGLHWGSGILTYTAESLMGGYFSTKKSGDSLRTILSRIDSATFYWDLLLWFLVPGVHSEEMLGDLNEEYLLRVSDEGLASAKAWYQHQALTTIMQCLWKRAERIATIATLIDLVERWLKK
jgi:hypothetical protein